MPHDDIEILEERRNQVFRKGEGTAEIACGKRSAAGSVSQRACVFCGSRVVLYPIADALHVVHGPIGCAAYTWDIRGAHSSGPSFIAIASRPISGERRDLRRGKEARSRSP